jgi:hypothetical protein
MIATKCTNQPKKTKMFKWTFKWWGREFYHCILKVLYEPYKGGEIDLSVRISEIKDLLSSSYVFLTWCVIVKLKFHV